MMLLLIVVYVFVEVHIRCVHLAAVMKRVVDGVHVEHVEIVTEVIQAVSFVCLNDAY